MPDIITIADFTGEFSVPSDKFTEPNEITPFIEESQFDLIYQVMGAELGALFIADLDSGGVPQTTRFENLYNAFIEDSNSCLVKSEGIKEMVKAYLYSKLAQNNNISFNMAANVVKQGENSVTTNSAMWIAKKYNQAIATAKAIQWYICQNSADYPEENMQPIEYLSIY
jgi:hypothetical protein